jgi:Restriction Enzyme Adenine Methylase Associated
LLPAQRGLEAVATVLPDGKIAYADDIYSTPSAASGAASGTATNGWTFWAADTPEGVASTEVVAKFRLVGVAS